MTEYEAIRDSTQEEVERVVAQHIEAAYTHFSREEAENALGKSWSNVSDVSVTSGEVSDVLDAVGALRESGFYVSAELPHASDKVTLEVGTSHEVFTRHHQRVMAQATAEADEAWAEDAPSGEAEHLSDEDVEAELNEYESVK